jgi:methyl-accepting chemotaxis protein
MKLASILFLRINRLPLFTQGILTILLIIIALLAQNLLITNIQNNINTDIETGNDFIVRDLTLISDYTDLFYKLTELVRLKEELLLATISNIDTYVTEDTTTLFQEITDTSALLVEQIVARSESGYRLSTRDISVPKISNLTHVSEFLDFRINTIFTSLINNVDNTVISLENALDNFRIYNNEFYKIQGIFPNIQNNFSSFFFDINSRLNALDNDNSTTAEDYEYLAKLAILVGQLESYVLSAVQRAQEVYAKLLATPFNELGIMSPSWRNFIQTNIDVNLKALIIQLENHAINTTSDIDRIEVLSLLLVAEDHSLVSNYLLIQTEVDKIISAIQNYNNLITISLVSHFDEIGGYIDIILIELRLQNEAFIRNFSLHIGNQQAIAFFITTTVSAFLLVIVLGLVGPFVKRVTSTTSKLDKGFKMIAQKNLGVELFEKYDAAEIGRIQKGYDLMVSDLREIIKKLAGTSENLAIIAQSMAASAEEASASINDVSDTIGTIAMGASQQSQTMEHISNSLNIHLKEVEQASAQILETSDFVKQVAKRTNILGLNASIEAAKAGHFGGGFAVVADNVRELSDDTKKSANNISELIEDVAFKINRTVQNVLKEVNQMREITENTTAGSEEANASSNEQVTMLSEISEQASEVAKISAELYSLISEFNL